MPSIYDMFAAPGAEGSTYRPADDPANYQVGGQRQDPFSIPMAWLNYMKKAAEPEKKEEAPAPAPYDPATSIIFQDPTLQALLQQSTGAPLGATQQPYVGSGPAPKPDTAAYLNWMARQNID